MDAKKRERNDRDDQHPRAASDETGPTPNGSVEGESLLPSGNAIPSPSHDPEKPAKTSAA